MFLVPFLSFLVGSSYALSIPFTAQRRAPAHSTTVTVTNPNANGNLGFSNDEDFLYTATVYVQGQPFQVQIDSGSSDLWINTEGVSFTGLAETGHNATITYVDTTSASGPVVLANVSLGEFTVEGQAFIDAPGSNASTPGFDQGLLGVGPPLASSVFYELNGTQYDGFPFLVNIFNFYPDEPNFITFLLSRSNIGITQGGVMTIAELVANLTEITSTPKLPVISELSWETYMDGVYVNGEFLTGHSLGANYVTAAPGPNQTTIIFDTGTSLATAPPFYVDAMYKHISGAKFSDDLQTYTLPCHSKVNISMVFGDRTFPINPIDAIAVNVNPDGSYSCQAAFSYSPADSGLDFILGDTFMRNVYTLLDYGTNFTGTGNSAPFMQILSTTDANEAWAEFDKLNIQRIAQLEYQNFASSSSMAEAASATATFSLTAPSGAATSSPVTTASVPHSSSASASASSSTASADPKKLNADLAAAAASSFSPSSSPVDLSGLTRNTYIIMGLLGGVLVLLIAVLAKMISNARANKGYREISTMRPPMHFEKPYEPDSEVFSTPYDDPRQ
ncbi:hypothetical protein AcW1_008309 [Taiwanofungus camphoratus]|nr:hypothetical protein AcV5_008603 [Antrodia cinnamomea]KAI0951207.1 hypothetical protein AcW1_008309 [Antrodia cinnamomea]KAI0956096.1 hypothetical protein AcV7_006592 [Antrodia cinnamomea]KAI0956097.1 hypothetical protein AcV7_006592 [Antrodia cinnamomea]